MEHSDSLQSHDVVAGVLVRNHRVLLCHRHPNRAWYPDVWDLPGGHIEPGEKPAKALVRELKEELDITVEEDCAEPLDSYSPTSDLAISIWVINVWSGDVVNAAPSEHDEIGWFTIDEVDRLNLADPYVAEACRRAAP